MAWSFKARLLTGFILTGVAVATVGAAAAVAVLHLTTSAEDVIFHHAENRLGAESLRACAEQLVASGRAYLLTGHEHYLDRSKSAELSLRRSLDELRSRSSPADEASLAAIEAAEREYETAFEHAIALQRGDSDPAAVVDYFEERMRPRRDALEDALNAYVAHSKLVFQERKLEARRMAVATVGFIVVVALVALVANGLIAALVTRRLGRLHALTERAKCTRETTLWTVSHELRTPLNALGLQLQLLRTRTATLDDATRSRLESLGGRIARLVSLLGRILDASRIESGRLRLELDDVDMARLAEDVISGAEAEIQASGCAVELRAPLPVVGRWDRLRLEQLLTNLLSNALKYGAGKPIEVTVDAVKDEAYLVVRDHGVGISKEDQARIFVPFERGAHEQDRAGVGLGLWIVKQIVEAMGGRITVTSEPGAGATFTVVLPLDGSGNGRLRVAA